MTAPTPYTDIPPRPAETPAFLVVGAVPTAVVRVEAIAIARLGEVFDRSFGAIFAALGERGIAPAGPAFALYTRMTYGEDAEADLEIGVPLTAPFGESIAVGGAEVVASEIPAGEVATLGHVGPYDGLAGAWGRLMGAIAEAGKSPGMPCWEIYVTEPEPDGDPSEWRTDLYCLVV